MDSVRLFSGSKRIAFESYPDKSGNYLYVWHQLPEGIYQFRMYTIFGKVHTMDINLNCDSSIMLNDIPEPLFSELIGIDMMRNSDTIEIIYMVNGCFSDHKEKVTVYRKQSGGYILKHFYDSAYLAEFDGYEKIEIKEIMRLRNVGNEVLDSLYALQTELRQIALRAKSDSFMRVSTTRHEVYISTGDFLFGYSDRSSPSYTGFSDFISSFFRD